MKKLITLTLSLFVLSNSFAQVTNEQIIAFAQKNYMNLLGSIPEKNLSDYGLKSKSDLNTLKFTTVFTEFAIKDNVLSATQNYRVLVLNLKNEPCGLLTIFNSNNILSVADYGALGLSKELAIQKENVKSNSYAIYRDYTTQSDFLFDGAEKKEDASFYKLFSKSVLKYSEAVNNKN